MAFNIFKRKKEETENKQVEKPVIEEKPNTNETKNELPNYKKPINEIESKIDKSIIEVMKNIKDPELELDIWTLGLVYDADVKDKVIDIKMTFTSPLCPYGPEIVNQIKSKLSEIGFDSNIELVFSPPWQPDEEVRDILGIPY